MSYYHRQCQSYAKPLHGQGMPNGFRFECNCGAKSAFDCPYKKNAAQPSMDKLDRPEIQK